MKDKLKFSVIIPCYNDPTRIRRSVESCLAQTYPPFEVIIIDDGSEAPTISVINELVAEYEFKKVRAIFLKKNQGVSVARNTGMEKATGDFICFLDSDDLWHPEKLLKVKEFINKTSENSIALAHNFTYDLNDFRLEATNSSSEFERITFAKILFKNPVTTPSLVIPCDAGITFRENMRHAEDHEFLLRLSKQCKIFFLDEKLVFINRALGSKGGLSGETGKMRLGEMKMYFLLCKSDWRFYPLLPFLIVYSISKHIRKVILNTFRSPE